MKGLTKSTVHGATAFVLHVRQSYDELIYSNKQSEVIEVIKRLYAQKVKKNLAIFGVEGTDLWDFTTTEKNAIFGFSKMPLRKLRLKDERVYSDQSSSSDEDEEDEELFDEFDLIDEKEVLDYESHIKGLNSPDVLNREAKEMLSSGSSLIQGPSSSSAGEKNVVLNDFKILKVIDKGSFGKVFLVRLEKTGQLYAMKRIRKDILIEKGQIQNTKNEKDILLNISHPFLIGMDYVFQNEHRIYFFLDYVK